MEDKFQTLISQISILKDNQCNKEKEIQKMLTIFEANKEKLKASNDNIISIANQLKEEITKGEEDKKGLIDLFISLRSKIDKDTDKSKQQNQYRNAAVLLPYIKII